MKQIITVLILALAAGAVMAQPALKVDANSEVGIGIADPTAKLHVIGEVKVEPSTGILATLSGNAVEQRISVTNNTTQENSTSYLTMNGSTSNGNFVFNGASIGFRVNKQVGNFGVKAMNLGADGRLGIGTDTPGHLLEVNGSAAKPGGGMWTAASDRRLKKNINSFDLGLKEVLEINPVTFQYNGKGTTKNNGETYVGVIAQDFQKIDPASVSKVEMNSTIEEIIPNGRGGAQINTKIKESKEYLAVDPSSITYMLVNSIKEQQQFIEDQQEQINSLLSRIRTLESNLGNSDISKPVLSMDINEATLAQNVPNPFSEQTSIEYKIPAGASNSMIRFFGMDGKVIKSVNLTSQGTGVLNLSDTGLTAGTYTYQLIIDGIAIDSKKMVVN